MPSTAGTNPSKQQQVQKVACLVLNTDMANIIDEKLQAINRIYFPQRRGGAQRRGGSRGLNKPLECLEDEGGCWIVTSHKPGQEGYIPLNRDGRTLRLHRLAWEIYNNQKIPNGLEILHTCNNKPCIKPEHLLLGTHVENMVQAYKDGLVSPPHRRSRRRRRREENGTKETL